METIAANHQRQGKTSRSFVIRVARGMTLATGALVATHFIARGYVALETDVIDYAVGTANAAVDTAARELGYERPAPPPDALTIRDMLDRECLRHRLNPSLCRALAQVESNFNPLAVSPVGAIGVMQVMPANAKRCGLPHPGLLFDAQTNVRCGVGILAEELRNARGDLSTALQTYNGGPRCVGRCQESIKHAREVIRTMVGDIG